MHPALLNERHAFPSPEHADAEGLVAFGGDLSLERLIEELDYYFQAIDTIFRKHGVEKIKTIGDAYLAVTGLPVPDEGHALTALDAAVEILDFIKKEKEKEN